MKTLWVYGCSHSNGWVWNNNSNIHNYLNPWPKLVADNIGYNLINRAKEGSSFQNIRDKILNDITSWDNEDLIIIQETHRVRATTPYIIDNLHIQRTKGIIDISESLDSIERINWEYFLNTIDIIKNLKKSKFYFILTDPPLDYFDERFVNNKDSFIKLPNSVCLKDWIKSNENIQQKDNGHMNQLGNEILSEIIIESITKSNEQV